MAPVLYCCLLAGMPGPAVLELIEPREFLVQVGPDEQKAYRYRLFRPRQIEKNRLYPLIVWLHGYGNGEFEAIGVGQLNHVQNLLPDRNAAENAHFFFLALQCPTDQRGFLVPTIRPLLAVSTPNRGKYWFKSFINYCVRTLSIPSALLSWGFPVARTPHGSWPVDIRGFLRASRPWGAVALPNRPSSG